MVEPQRAVARRQLLTERALEQTALPLLLSERSLMEFAMSAIFVLNRITITVQSRKKEKNKDIYTSLILHLCLC